MLIGARNSIASETHKYKIIERLSVIMKYYKHPDFIKSLHTLYRKDDKYRQAAMRVLAILAKIQEQDVFSSNEIIHRINQTKNGEKRVSNCIKYDLGSGCRLVTTKNNEEQIFLFAGTHDNTETWLNNHKRKTFSKIDIKNKKDKIPILKNLSKENINIPTDVHDVVESAFNNLLNESRANKYSISTRRNEIADIRENIRISMAELNNSKLTECDKNYNEQNEIKNTKNDISKYNCQNMMEYIQKTDKLVKENNIKDASKLVEPMESNIALLKLRLKYIQSLEMLISEMKSEITFREKLHKLAIALGLDVPDEGDKKIPTGKELV